MKENVRELKKEEKSISHKDNSSVISKTSTTGITLVALVVTIVVLLILAGITLTYVLGDNSVFKQALDAKINTELAKIEEESGIIYSNKVIDKHSGKIDNIVNKDIVDELISNGNQIEIRKISAGDITEISVNPNEVTLEENETKTVKVLYNGSDDGNIYYAVVDGKYYKMNFNNGLVTIERKPSDLEGTSTEGAILEIASGYDTTIITNIQINESENTINLTSGTKYGNTVMTVKYGSNTTTCSVIVEEKETDWAWMNRVAKAIANDNTITSSSTQAVGRTEKGEEYNIEVGNIYKLRYNGKIKRVRVLGFKHDDLVDTEVYGGNHQKAGISFEFYNPMNNDFILMNSNRNDINGWGGSTLRASLNGTEDNISGMGANLSNKQYIKKVTKAYLMGDPSTIMKSCQDWLWLLSCAEIWTTGASYEYKAGYAREKEGNQYAFYKKNVGNLSCKNENSWIAKKNETSANLTNMGWGLRSFDKMSTLNGMYMSRVTNKGSCEQATAVTGVTVCPGFCI